MKTFPNFIFVSILNDMEIEFNMFNLIFYEPYNLLLIITKP